MKTKIYTFIGLIIVLTISSVTAANAQSAATARANIPFDFSVKNKLIPAGGYVMSRQDDRGNIWSLRSRDNSQSVFLLAMGTEPRRTSGKGKLTFHRYGNEYFLTNIETAEYQIRLPKCRAERSLEKKLANKSRLTKNKTNDLTAEIISIKLEM